MAYTKTDALRDAKQALKNKGFIITEMKKENPDSKDSYKGTTIEILNTATQRNMFFYLSYGKQQYIGILHGLVGGFDII